jgi:hypothetical protein
MTALAKDRNTPYRRGDVFAPPVKGATLIYSGSLVCVDAGGFAVPGATALGLRAVGRAEARADNSAGVDGAIRAKTWRSIFRWENSAAGDAITQADVGNDAYIVDDQTVAKTNGTNTRSRAGVIVDVDDLGVWVLTGFGY